MINYKISILESVYLIFMFLFFKTSVDFNVLRSPSGWLFEHLTGDEYGLRICPFGRIAIFFLIIILIGRHYFKIPQIMVNISLFIAFILSLMNMNAVVYLMPIFLIEICNSLTVLSFS